MKWLASPLSLIVVLSSASSAYADWQYTKWGMSVEQAARASSGQLRIPTAQERSTGMRRMHAGGAEIMPGLVGVYHTSTFVFSCQLYFPPPNLGLARVALTATGNAPSSSIIEALRGLYGEPIESSRGIGGTNYRWRDDAHNTSIEVYDLSSIGTLNIFYAPLRSGAEKGL